MKIGVLLPTNVYFAPYSRIYTDIFDEIGVKYDIIYFDKRNLDEPAAYRFTQQLNSTDGSLKRLLGYYRYSRFLIKTIKKEKYDRLVVCGPQIAIFISRFLIRHYRGRYILDYRDLSIEQRFMSRYRKLLRYSAYNMISSPGFKRCLPQEASYMMSHNISIALLREAVSESSETPPPAKLFMPEGKMTVLTIGGIRDYDQNAAVMQALANQRDFSTSFIGRGEEGADVKLRELAQKEHIENVFFAGFYKKEEEPRLIQQSTFLNIFYPRKLSHDTALSNRFYSSLLFRKPMITTADTIQGDYAQQYGIGVAIDTADGLSDKLKAFADHFDSSVYEAKRKELLISFLDDYTQFRQAVETFSR